MLGRSKLEMNCRAWSSARRSTISRRVGASAVAVRAMRGTFGKRSCSTVSSRYSGRKSWPHCDTQVGLVDREQRHRRAFEQVQETSGEQPLSRHIQEFQTAAEEAPLDIGLRGRIE